MLHVLHEKKKGRTEKEREKKIHKFNLYFTDKRLDVISVLGRVIRVILIHLTFNIQKPPVVGHAYWFLFFLSNRLVCLILSAVHNLWWKISFRKMRILGRCSFPERISLAFSRCLLTSAIWDLLCQHLGYPRAYSRTLVFHSCVISRVPFLLRCCPLKSEPGQAVCDWLFGRPGILAFHIALWSCKLWVSAFSLDQQTIPRQKPLHPTVGSRCLCPAFSGVNFTQAF